MEICWLSRQFLKAHYQPASKFALQTFTSSVGERVKSTGAGGNSVPTSSRCRHRRIGAVADIAEPTRHRIQPQRHDAAVAVEDGFGRRGPEDANRRNAEGVGQMQWPGVHAHEQIAALHQIEKRARAFPALAKVKTRQRQIPDFPLRPLPGTAPAPGLRFRNVYRAKQRVF